MLTIKKSVIEAITNHSKNMLPNEACGYIASLNGVVTTHFELTNLDQSPEHFSMDPKEQFAAIKEMRGKGLKLAAVYHSHPETPARPSEEDIKLAYDPEVSYLIVSLASNQVSIKSFKIQNKNIKNEPIEIID